MSNGSAENWSFRLPAPLLDLDLIKENENE